LKELIPIYLIRFLSLLPLPIIRCMGRLLGFIAWRLNTKDADTTRKNIALCFPQKSAAERSVIARKSLEESAKTLCEVAIAWCWTQEKIHHIITAATGVEICESAYSSGKGVIVCAPHLGNWEILGHYLAKRYPLTNMYMAPENPHLHKLLLSGRTRNGSELAPANRRGVADVLKKLTKGELVGILPDQVPEDEGSGVFAPFFNQPAFTMKLISNLLRKTGCKIIFAYAKRVPHGFEIVFHDVDENIYSEDLLIATTALNRGIELCVNEAVEQYQWEYKRFKKMPGNTTKIYDQMSY